MKPVSKVELSQAALGIPSFAEFAKRANDVEKMEQDLLQKQLKR